MRRRQVLASLGAATVASVLPGIRADPQRDLAKPWRSGALLPFATQEIYPAFHQGEIYVAGGIASRMGVPYFTNRCVAYDPSIDTWHEAPELPEALHHAALVSNQKRLLLVGGFNGGYTHIWRMRKGVLELTLDGWQQVSELPLAQAEGVVTVASDGHIHIVTGQSPTGEANGSRGHHREVRAHWRWDGEGSWTQAAPIPTARNSATGAWVNGQLIVAGGRTSAGNLSTTEIYDPGTDSWTTARDMPLAQAGTASVAVGSDLIVFGGEIFTPEAGVFKEVWRYQSATDRWDSLPPLPTPRHGLGAVRVGKEVFVMAGATKPSGRGTSGVLEILDLTQLWAAP